MKGRGKTGVKDEEIEEKFAGKYKVDVLNNGTLDKTRCGGHDKRRRTGSLAI